MAPEIDVSDVILDPYIAGERFLVIRRMQIVNNFGRVTVTPQEFRPVGSLRPVGDNALISEEAYRAQSKTLRCITLFRLRGVSRDGERRDFLPDIVRWSGADFLVVTVEDFSSYGAGFIQANCTSLNFVDRPPELTPDMLLSVTDRSLVIATTGVAEQLMPANPGRVGWFVQNPKGNSDPITINEIGGAATTFGSIILWPEDTFPPPNYPIVVNAISVAGTEDNQVIAREW